MPRSGLVKSTWHLLGGVLWALANGLLSGLSGGRLHFRKRGRPAPRPSRIAGTHSYTSWERRSTAQLTRPPRMQLKQPEGWVHSPLGALCLTGILTLCVLGAVVGLIAWGAPKGARAVARLTGAASAAAAPDDKDTPSAPASTGPERAFRNDFDELIGHDPRVPARDWKAVVMHHSATARGSATAFGNYHTRVKGWRSLGYHFVIGNGLDVGDGEIEVGPRWRQQEAGAHAKSHFYNEHGIGICLVGNFELSPPTPAQLRALRTLLGALERRFDIPREKIFGHHEVREGGGTVCPGRFFPMDEVRTGDAR